MDIAHNLHLHSKRLSFHRTIMVMASVLSLLASGCGLLIGGNQHVDTKSRDYTILRLDRDPNTEWVILSETESLNKDGFPQDSTDMAFENKSTRAIISLNSVCGATTDKDLERLSKNLLMGLGDDPAQIKTERIQVDSVDAAQSTLETTVSIKEKREPTKVRTVVLHKSGCTYDFMYIAKPLTFEKSLESFHAFLRGFHVK